MPIPRSEAERLIARLESLPFAAQTSAEGWSGLIDALAERAESVEQAAAAIEALLTDTARASNPTTDRMPSKGELLLWIQAQQQPVAERDSGWSCGRIIDGWQYLDYPVEGVSLSKVWHQSKCERGWIRRTQLVDSGYVDKHGLTIMQPYEFSARCRCVGGAL